MITYMECEMRELYVQRASQVSEKDFTKLATDEEIGRGTWRRVLSRDIRHIIEDVIPVPYARRFDAFPVDDDYLRCNVWSAEWIGEKGPRYGLGPVCRVKLTQYGQFVGDSFCLPGHAEADERARLHPIGWYRGCIGATLQASGTGFVSFSTGSGAGTQCACMCTGDQFKEFFKDILAQGLADWQAEQAARGG